LFFVLTGARTVVIRLTLEAENLATGALDVPDVQIVDLDTIDTIDSRTELIIAMDGREQLRNALLV
jgi:hypothetical protein